MPKFEVMKDIQTLLENYKPNNLKEVKYKSKMIDFYKNYNNCFSREQEYGHFTASSFLLNSSKTKFLLMLHRKINIWVQPGGHCDGDPIVLRTALKEAQEESGINEIKILNENIFDIDIHKFPKTREVDEHYHFDIRFLLKTDGNDDFKINEESLDMKWFSFKQVLDNKLDYQDSIVRMVEKYMNDTKFQITPEIPVLVRSGE